MASPGVTSPNAPQRLRAWIAAQETHHAVFPVKTSVLFPLHCGVLCSTHELHICWQSPETQRRIYNIVLDCGLLTKQGVHITTRKLQACRASEMRWQRGGRLERLANHQTSQDNSTVRSFAVSVHGQALLFAATARTIYDYLKSIHNFKDDFIVEVLDPAAITDHQIFVRSEKLTAVADDSFDRSTNLLVELYSQAEELARRMTAGDPVLPSAQICLMRKPNAGPAQLTNPLDRLERRRTPMQLLQMGELEHTVCVLVGSNTTGDFSALQREIEAVLEVLKDREKFQGAEDVQVRILEW